MMSVQEKTPGEIELLLPWHAAGTLNREEAERVEAALANDAELRRRYQVAREELAETIHLNESLGAPSVRAIERVMARIEAEARAPSARRESLGIFNWLTSWVGRLSPPVLAWSAAAAVVLILLQAGLLAGLYVERGGRAGYQTASVPQLAEPAGSYALLGFVPEASAAEVTSFLETSGVEVVAGPRAGGLFKVKVGPANMAKSELDERVKRMAESKVVRFAVVAE